jgi:two-component system cell cycle sensor histidine kinase/response regulator CckA
MGRASILVVDDERPILTLISRVLEAGGHRVHTAGNGQDALALCKSLTAPIDLLITDIVMPGMDGLRLAESVERVFPGVRVLFMSGKCDVAALRKHIANNTRHHFLPKPFSLPELACEVRDMLGGTRLRASA